MAPTVYIEHTSSALGSSTVKSINGTYSGCFNRSGSWSALVSGTDPLDNAALTVVKDDTSCVLAITEVNADQLYTTSSPITLSPQNIPIGTDGVARITDFGIARGTSDPRQTRQNARRGKLGYMAPEYLTTSQFSPQSDIFAIGVVMWEALAGYALFRGLSVVESIEQVLANKTPPASSACPGLPVAFDRVITRCLAPTAARRFATAQELAHVVESAFPGLASREEVIKVVTKAAGDKLEKQRQAITLAKHSTPPAAQDTVLDLDIAALLGELNHAEPTRSKLLISGEPGDTPGSQASTMEAQAHITGIAHIAGPTEEVDASELQLSDPEPDGHESAEEREARHARRRGFYKRCSVPPVVASSETPGDTRLLPAPPPLSVTTKTHDEIVPRLHPSRITIVLSIMFVVFLLASTAILIEAGLN